MQDENHRITNDSETVLFLLSDPITTRLFLETGLLERLIFISGRRFVVIIAHGGIDIDQVKKRLNGCKVLTHEEALGARALNRAEKTGLLVDDWLNDKFGYYPASIRLNYDNGFNLKRMERGHRNIYFNPDHIGPLPLWKVCSKGMRAWYFSRFRYHHPGAAAFLRAENISAIVYSNCQIQRLHVYGEAARKMGIRIIGFVGSWDHPVGKGIMPSYYKRYIVQNRMMENELVKYHQIEPGKIMVKGWPQMDQYTADVNDDLYHLLLHRWGVDPVRPVILFAGNSETNTPTEPEVFAQLIDWRDKTHGPEAWTAIVRPHPKDFRWADRYASFRDRPGVVIQGNSISDIDELSLLLKNVSAVVCCAGTILLDSIVNDRPAIGLTYDIDTRSEQSRAMENFTLYNYTPIMKSNAFYRADSYEEATQAIERALEHPDELIEERLWLRKLLIGAMDGLRMEANAIAIAKEFDFTGDGKNKHSSS